MLAYARSDIFGHPPGAPDPRGPRRTELAEVRGDGSSVAFGATFPRWGRRPHPTRRAGGKTRRGAPRPESLAAKRRISFGGAESRLPSGKYRLPSGKYRCERKRAFFRPPGAPHPSPTVTPSPDGEGNRLTRRGGVPPPPYGSGAVAFPIGGRWRRRRRMRSSRREKCSLTLAAIFSPDGENDICLTANDIRVCDANEIFAASRRKRENPFPLPISPIYDIM